MSLGRASWTALVALALSGAAACDEDATRDPLPDWSEGYDQGGDGVPDAGMPEITGAFGVYAVEGTGVPTRAHRTGSDADCAIEDLDGTPDGFRDIECTLDIEELDLHGPGLSFLLHAPRGLCAYLIWWWYQYEAWEVGQGPETVSYTIDDLGNITDETDSVGGVPYCPYDYRSWGGGQDAPNCCLGAYVLEVTDAESGETTTYPPQAWGGKPSECYGGAAYLWPDAQFTADGWPTAYYMLLNYAEHTELFEWPDEGAVFATNVPLANYFEASDHDGTRPAGLAGAWAVEHYNLICADHAYEWLAHVKLTVREWNEQAEFERDGDPDTEGTEESGQPIDDFADWATATPGDATFIEAGQ